MRDEEIVCCEGRLAPMPTPMLMPAPRTVLMPTDHLQLELVSIIRISIIKADSVPCYPHGLVQKVSVRLLAGNTW